MNLNEDSDDYKPPSTEPMKWYKSVWGVYLGRILTATNRTVLSPLITLPVAWAPYLRGLEKQRLEHADNIRESGVTDFAMMQ